LQVTLCDSYLSALSVRYYNKGAIQIHFLFTFTFENLFEHFKIFATTWHALLHLTRIAMHPHGHCHEFFPHWHVPWRKPFVVPVCGLLSTPTFPRVRRRSAAQKVHCQSGSNAPSPHSHGVERPAVCLEGLTWKSAEVLMKTEQYCARRRYYRYC